MTSASSLFKALIAAIALGHCHAAIVWRAVGCDGATVGGESIDDIWDNARAMAQNAGSAIDNARAMFDISFQFGITGLPTAARATMTTVKAVFDGIATQMQTNNGYLWCGDDKFVPGPSYDPNDPNSMVSLGVWQYPIPGTSDVLVLAGKTGDKQLCKDPNLLGETLRGVFRTTTGPNGATQDNPVVGIILCLKNLNNYVNNRGMKTTLPLGYATGPSVRPGPDPEAYSSVAGTIVHEMVHFRDTSYYRDQTVTENGRDVTAYRYARAAALAREASWNDAYLKNPDNYRVFAEMSMSPATRWGAAAPPGAAKRNRAARSRRSSGPAAVEEKKAGAVFLGQRDSPLLELEVRNASLVTSD